MSGGLDGSTKQVLQGKIFEKKFQINSIQSFYFYIKLFNPSADKRLNWFEAENYCKNIGGHLASFNSLSSLSAVSSGQQIFFIPSDLAFWIGLNALANKGFEWIDGSAVSYENWDFGYPQKLNGVEECVELRTSNRWRDTFCYVNKGWICSIEKGVDPNNATSQLLPIDKFNSLLLLC
jgi:hypothetical protein